jgi:hypothetical protein
MNMYLLHDKVYIVKHGVFCAHSPRSQQSEMVKITGILNMTLKIEVSCHDLGSHVKEPLMLKEINGNW